MIEIYEDAPGSAIDRMSSALRVAEGELSSPIDALRAQVEMLREACRMGIRAIATGEQYEHELYAALAATEPKGTQP